VKALASLLRRLANRIDAPALPSAPATEPGEQMRHAQRFCDDLILRDALRRALNRYQPFRPTAQA
jgi:hypothetical protein